MSSSQKSLKSLLILAVVASALTLYIVGVEIPHDEAKAAAKKIFQGLTVEDVESIKVKNQYGSFELRHSDKTSEGRPALELVSTPGAMLSSQTVTELISAVSEVETSDPIEDPETDLSLYGLQPAVTELVIDSKKDAPRRVLIGKENAFARKRYAQFEGDSRIYLLSDALYSASDIKEEGVRERKPIRFESYNLKSIDLGGQGVLSQDDKGAWSITAPVPMKVDDGAVSKFLRALKDAEVDTFLSDSAHPSSYDKKFVLHYKDGKDVSFGFKIEKDGVVGALSYEPLPYRFKKEIADTIKTPLDELRVKKPLSKISLDTVSKLSVRHKMGIEYTIIGSQPEVVAEKTWKFERDGKDADEAFVKQWVADISSASIAKYVNISKDVGLNPPAGILTIDMGTEPAVVVSIGAHTPKGQSSGYYATVSGYEGEIFVFSDDTVKKLIPNPELLEKKQNKAS